MTLSGINSVSFSFFSLTIQSGETSHCRSNRPCRLPFGHLSDIFCMCIHVLLTANLDQAVTTACFRVASRSDHLRRQRQGPSCGQSQSRQSNYSLYLPLTMALSHTTSLFAGEVALLCVAAPFELEECLRLRSFSS